MLLLPIRLNIPPALLDQHGSASDYRAIQRMRKLNIATRYLLPKQMKNHGLKENELVQYLRLRYVILLVIIQEKQVCEEWRGKSQKFAGKW